LTLRHVVWGSIREEKETVSKNDWRVVARRERKKAFFGSLRRGASWGRKEPKKLRGPNRTRTESGLLRLHSKSIRGRR